MSSATIARNAASSLVCTRAGTRATSPTTWLPNDAMMSDVQRIIPDPDAPTSRRREREPAIRLIGLRGRDDKSSTGWIIILLAGSRRVREAQKIATQLVWVKPYTEILY